MYPQSSPSSGAESGGLPVGWAEDFDLYDPDYLADPYGVWAGMRTECPVARTERHSTGYLPSRHADITATALDPRTFSSRAGEVTGPVPEVLWPPHPAAEGTNATHGATSSERTKDRCRIPR